MLKYELDVTIPYRFNGRVARLLVYNLIYESKYIRGLQ